MGIPVPKPCNCVIWWILDRNSVEAIHFTYKFGRFGKFLFLFSGFRDPKRIYFDVRWWVIYMVSGITQLHNSHQFLSIQNFPNCNLMKIEVFILQLHAKLISINLHCKICPDNEWWLARDVSSMIGLGLRPYNILALKLSLSYLWFV